MNTTTRLTRYAGAGFAAFAATCILSAPASAMNLPGPPVPVHGQSVDTQTHTPAASRSTGTSAAPASSGIDWSTLTTGLLVGAGLSGAIGLAGMQTRRHRHSPNPA